jgi:hypothetical protein
MQENEKLPTQDLIDQSKLLRGRVRRRIAESKDLMQRIQHRWERIAVGRVCADCRTAQALSEFDDTVPCEPNAS